jgi:transcription initiation factor TFIID subunit 10
MANADSPNAQNAALPAANGTEEDDNPVAPAPEPKLPNRKDASLKEFLGKMDDYAPIVRASVLPSALTILYVHWTDIILRFQMP